jgi:hypothetical protein
MGNALRRAVMLPHDLRPFLEERGIELRLIPHGSGPRYWTLENAAVAIADQEGWSNAARGTLLDQLVDAANARELVVREPHTGLVKGSGSVRPFYEVVMPSDVNTWLESQATDYRWRAHEEEERVARLTDIGPPSEAPPLADNRTHSTKTAKAHALDHVIAIAQAKSADPANYQEVFAQLEVLAIEEMPPLTGSTTEGLMYSTQGVTKFYKKSSLKKKLIRARAK